MHYLKQVQRGIDFIEEHLDFDIQSAEVARRAGISHWYFQRIFKALTNETLKTYIRSRRMANALNKLSGSDQRILEIAVAAGFQTQESFTRAFKSAFGVTPADYRRNGKRFQFLRKVRIDSEYLAHIHESVSLEPEIYEQPAMTLVGLKTHFYSVDSDKNNIAQALPALWGAFLPRLGDVREKVSGTCYGVLRPREENAEQLEYLACIGVSVELPPPRGMAVFRLPAGRYAKFTHRGKVERVDSTVNYIYSSWLARSGLRHTYAADIEFYGDEYHPESDESVIHYAIPVAPEGDDEA